MPTVTIYPTTWLRISDQTAGGGQVYEIVGGSEDVLLSDGVYSTQTEYAKIAFDFSGIPKNAILLSATFYANITDFNGNPQGAGGGNPSNNLGIAFNVGRSGYSALKMWPVSSLPNQYYPIDITSVAKYHFDGNSIGYVNVNLARDGWQGRLTFSSPGSSTSKPYIIVNYNELPSTPIVTSPNGGESIDKTHVITWDPSTDAETSQENLRYQIQLSVNNGNAWKDIITLTNPGVTSYTYDFSAETETATAKIRIRSNDGSNFGNWDESDGVFTIQHNIAPTTPSSLKPNGSIVDRTKTNRFTWLHNDSPNDIQSKADIRWRAVGAAVWNDIISNGPEQEYYFAANTLPNGQIEWQVRTYDSEGLVSPWSDIAVITSAEPTAAPTIVSPDSPVNVARPIIQWTSASQASYQVIIEDSLGATVWDTGEIVSTVKARTAGVDLINGATYKIKIRVKDGSGLFSSFTEKTVNVEYTPPARPILQAFKAEASIQLVVTNPQPTGTQPMVFGNDIYKVIDGEWVRIAANVNATFTDYAVADGVEYRYFAVALGETGVYSNSDEVTQSVAFKGTYIHDPLDPEFTVQHFVYNGTGTESEFTPETSLMKFVGRKRPVAQFGNYGEFAVNVTLQATSRDFTPMRQLREFVANRQPVCYRDDNGHFLYGIIQTLPITREYNVETANITVVEIDYDPEV